MGYLRPLKFAPRRIKEQFKEWLDADDPNARYLCGNCYFDLTDSWGS